MWEAFELKNEDFLWASTVFQGGIAGQQQATCGAVSSAAVCLGLRHRCSLADKEKVLQAKKGAFDDAAELVRSFIEKYGALTCIGLVEVDLSDEATAKKAIEAGILKKCDDQIQWVIEKLYELDERRSITERLDQ